MAIYVPKFDSLGRCALSNRYKEILRLSNMLDDEKIPFTLRRNFDGWQILYPSTPNFPSEKDDVVCSVIEHFGSFGQEIDTLEIMGLLTDEEQECDSVIGYLTAENVLERIKNHYEQEET